MQPDPPGHSMRDSYPFVTDLLHGPAEMAEQPLPPPSPPSFSPRNAKMFSKSPRKLLFFTLLALSYSSLVFASPTSAPKFGNLVVHDSRSEVPSGFTNAGPAPEEKTINLSLYLSRCDWVIVEDQERASGSNGC